MPRRPTSRRRPGPPRRADRRSGPPALVVVLAAGLVLVGACGGSGPSGAGAATGGGSTASEAPSSVLPGAAGGELDVAPTVVVVGDSITERGEPVLRAVLDGWTLLVDGRGGHRVAEQLPAAQALAGTGPEQVVVNLGTNDVLQDRSPTTAVADLRRVVAAFPGARCLHLVTVSERMVDGRRDLATPARRVNEGIRQIAGEDPRVDVVDWSGAVADAEEAGGGELVHDAVHPNAEGHQVLAELYAEALSSCSR